MRARLLLTSFFVTLVLGCPPNIRCQQAEGLETYRLTLPDKAWSLDISIPKLPNVKEGIENGRREYLLTWQERSFEPTLLTEWTITMVPAQPPGDGASLRDSKISFLVKKGLADKHGVKTSDYNHVSMATYKMDTIYKVLEAYLANDNVWITVTLRSNGLRKSDESAFYAALDSIKIFNTSAPSTSFDYYQKGRSLIVQGEYQGAIQPLTAAFDLELKKQQLDQLQSRGLVQAFVKAYRATGDRTRLKEILDFGVSRDPTYPGFHLLLARQYAGLGDLDNTITSLEKAFLYKNNTDEFTPSLPDPMSDPGFKRFQKIERFRQAVKAMKK